MMLPYSCRVLNWQRQSRMLSHMQPLIRLFSSETTWPDRIFSGIQPTGVLHIGNYFGAVKNWVDLQNSNHDVLCAIVDLHSMTLPYVFNNKSKRFYSTHKSRRYQFIKEGELLGPQVHRTYTSNKSIPTLILNLYFKIYYNDLRQCHRISDPQKLPQNIQLMAASLLGCGIDPEKSILFLQSEVPQHAQLCWILSTCTTLRRLARLPQYSEKSEYLEKPLLGLLWYPVLQAADILVYRATQVPVGRDQVQHLQLASGLVCKFNAKYGETFPVPQAIFNDNSAARIRSLQNPTKKMSKSFPDANSRIDITDPADVIASKLKLAHVEPTFNIAYDPKIRPGVSNFIEMHSALTGRQIADICQEFRDFDIERYRETVTEVMVETLRPIQREIERLLNDKEYILSTLKVGAQKATEIAADTWKTVTDKTGNHLIKSENK